MKPAPFSYVRPASIDEAVEALAADPEAKVLAGGQSLVPLLSMRLAAPTVLVDINRIDELGSIVSDETGVRFGALARHARVESDPEARRAQPLLSAALRLVAHPTIRNRGTTVGSIVHADAAGEMPMVLRLLGGSLTVRSTDGEREIAADDLFVGPLETSLRHGELATSAWVPSLAPGGGVAMDEISRRHGDYALCGVAAVVGTHDDGSLTSVRAGFLSVSETPAVVDLSAAFADGTGSDANLESAVEIATEAIDPEDDIHATADYRRHLAGVLTHRVVAAACRDAAGRRQEVPA